MPGMTLQYTKKKMRRVENMEKARGIHWIDVCMRRMDILDSAKYAKVRIDKIIDKVDNIDIGYQGSRTGCMYVAESWLFEQTSHRFN